MDYQTSNALQAEKTVKMMLLVLNLPVRGSYNANEVCRILGIADRTFWRLCRAYELDDQGKLIRPDCLNSFILGIHRRIPYLEIVEFIRRNNEYQRKIVQAKPEEKSDMQGHDDTEIALFRDYGVQYRISKFKEKRGSKGQSRTVYFLNKMLFPSQTRIRLRIAPTVAEEFEGLSLTEGMALCEELIAAELCQGCRKI